MLFFKKILTKNFSNFLKKHKLQEKKDLKDILNSPVGYERKNKIKFDKQFLLDFKEKNIWEITTLPNSSKIELKKDLISKEIKIVFKKKNKENVKTKKINFFIFINNFSGKLMVFDIFLKQQKIFINKIFFIADGEEDLYINNDYSKIDNYHGRNLNKEFQNLFIDYLINNLKIDGEIFSFIENSYALKDELMFSNWLNNFRKFFD